MLSTPVLSLMPVSRENVKGPSNSYIESYLFPMENQEKKKGRKSEAGAAARERNTNVQRALTPNMQGGRQEGTGCWSGDGTFI